MGLFGFGKRMEEETKGGCCCGSTSVNEPVNECCCGIVPTEESECGCYIKVLGAGCKSCHELHENVKKAVADMNTDMEKVMSYGVMSMPAIVVNEQVVSMGKVLKPAQVEELLKKLGC